MVPYHVRSLGVASSGAPNVRSWWTFLPLQNRPDWTTAVISPIAFDAPTTLTPW